MELKPIETVYKGYRFRSRLEARWAVFFDELRLPWEYEKEGYDLGEAGWYLPDFWLPQQRLWFEVKGQHATHEEDEKCRMLCLLSQTDVLLWVGDALNLTLCTHEIAPFEFVWHGPHGGPTWWKFGPKNAHDWGEDDIFAVHPELVTVEGLRADFDRYDGSTAIAIMNEDAFFQHFGCDEHQWKHAGELMRAVRF